MDIKEELLHITSEFFEDHMDYQKLLDTSKKYKSLLQQISGVEINNENGRKDIHFDNGKALGTFWAAMCIDDIIRTRQFIRGIDLAIKDKTNNNKSLHILYAGTGPFATLILPVILRHSDIEYTLLEINPLSFDILKKLIEKIGLNNKRIKLVNKDATKYQLDNNTPDIIVSETMQVSLDKEQQVPIFYNLMRQAKPDSIFIPEKIEIFIGLRESGHSDEEIKRSHYHKRNKIFEVSKASMFKDDWKLNASNDDPSFISQQTVLDKSESADHNQIVLLTEITVYGDEKIKVKESGLTMPKYISDIPGDQEGSIIIDSQYIISDDPQLKLKIA